MPSFFDKITKKKNTFHVMKSPCQEQTAELRKPITQIYLQHVSCTPGIIV